MEKLWIALGISLFIASAYGWIMNIVLLARMDWAVLGVEALLRIIGIPVVPLGIIMGLFV